MFGKHFESLYEGSMVGAGAIVFAVWGYVIAKQKPDKLYGSVVRLNPELLGAVIGEKPDGIVKAIEFLCSPDPRTYTPGDEGRRLVKIVQFDYRVVNGAMYRGIRNDEERRHQNRLAQQRYRAKLDAMTPEERAAYESGRAAVRKPRKMGKRALELMGRRDQVVESVRDANAEAKAAKCL